jgi:hypothetical protein
VETVGVDAFFYSVGIGVVLLLLALAIEHVGKG